MPKNKRISKNPALIVLVGMVIISAILALAWMLARELSPSTAKTVSENSTNIVMNNAKAPNQLVAALLNENTGCEGVKGISSIEKYNGNFALVKYGCKTPDAPMFYKRENGTWHSLNSTNNFINGVPLCSHVKMYSIPSTFQDSCYDTSKTSTGQSPALVANPVQ